MLATVTSAHVRARWLAARPADELSEPFIFVVSLDGQLRLAPRGSEHVDCAAEQPVLAAGEVLFRGTDEESADLERSRVGRLAAVQSDDLPVAEFAFPGPLRDQLVAAILAGAKTTTTGLVADYEHENEPLPGPGLRQAVVDSAGRPVAVIETTAVRVIRLADVDLNHALGEGEGYTSVAEWRAGHEQFWHSAELRQALGDPGFTVGDDTLVVAQEFRLVDD
jgi:uncharacterized protein YhfF